MGRRSALERKLAVLPVLAAAGFAAVLVATLVLSGLSRRELDRLRDGYVPATRTARELTRLLVAYQRHLQDAVTARDWTALADSDSIAELFGMTAARALANPVPEARLPQSIVEGFESYRDAARSSAVALMYGESLEPIRTRVVSMGAQYKALTVSLAAQTDVNVSRVDQTYVTLAALGTWTWVSILAMLVLVVAAIGFVARWIARDVRAMLAAVGEAAAHIAQGDVLRALDFGRRVELQPLAVPFHDICSYIEEIGQAADRLAHGAVDVTVSPRSERDVIARNLSQAIENRRVADEALRVSEEQFRQAQKLEAVGRLAGGVAHDFNNLLTAIRGHLELLAEEIPAEDPAHEHVAQVRHSAERAATLTRQLLAYSRRQVLRPKLLDLNEVLADAAGMLRPMIREDIQLTFEPGAGLWPVLIDPTQVEQVLMNLVVNARDAMPRGGTLRIRTANVRLDENYRRRRPTVVPGDHVALIVEDTGVGMDEATRERIFEPFFTTKRPGEGTGLGLATVYGIVKQSGGDVWVYSEPGIGTTFKIYLPRAEEPASPEEVVAAPGAMAAAGGTEVALVVEDEPAVRTLVLRVLRRRGYTVLEASNGVEALQLADHYHGDIHLLLTDVVMPELGGRELADALAARRPQLRVLFMSGYSEDAVLQREVLRDGVHYLEKPFTPQSLVDKVRRVLDQPAGAVRGRSLPLEGEPLPCS